MSLRELKDATVLIGVPGLNGGGVTTTELNAAVADRAPADATFIVQTADADLGNEQALASLGTGLLKNTTGTGELSIATGADVPDHDHSGVITGLSFIIDGGGEVITTGVKGDIEFPFACTVNPTRLLADQVGRVYVQVWKDTYANYPPTSGDQIHQFILYDVITVSDTTPITVNAGDIWRLNVSTISDVTRLTLAMTLTRSI